MQAAFARFSLSRKTNPHESFSSCPTADLLGILSVNAYEICFDAYYWNASERMRIGIDVCAICVRSSELTVELTPKIIS